MGEDEFFYVLKGQFQFKLGDQLVDAPAGSFIFLPRDHLHTFQNVGAETGLLLVGVTPAGLEHFFVERQGVDMETQQALFKKYGVDVVGPPLGSASTPASRR
jgi:mannose-6-phosphate isomerase-like protein (cupin superfamily)